MEKKTEKVSRRDFLKWGAAGAVSTAAIGILGYDKAAEAAAPVSVTMNYADTIEWNAQYDVVVIGFGGAGAVAAAVAADNGAKVLLTEKAEEGLEGGNTHYAVGFMMAAWDADLYYANILKGYRGAFTASCPDAVLKATAKGFTENWDFIKSIGGSPSGTLNKNADGRVMGMMAATDASGKDLGGKPFWNLVRNNVLSKKDVAIWYSSPAKHLIQDPITKTVLGVQIEKEGKVINVRANNGVIMTLGGFEFNEEIQQNYLGRAKIYPLGSKHNTGDGIAMVQEVGAKLWHMGNLSGPDYCIYDPELDMAYYVNYAAPNGDKRDQRANPLSGNSMILVGSDGTRFGSESEVASHGRTDIGGSEILRNPPHPFYAIFDQKTRMSGKFVNTFQYDDNRDILNWKTVTIDDSIEGLAKKMGMDGLADEVAKYNEYAKNGNDPKFGRDPKQMWPIENGPYYCMELVQGVYNTQGGAERNENCEILDSNGDVIPHLYSAGEFGAIWPDYYGGGMNIGECASSGRVAGKNAAAKKEAVKNFTLKTVASNIDNDAYNGGSGDAYEAGPNQYIGSANGMGKIVVRVTMDGQKIAKIEVLKSDGENPNIGTVAVDKLPQKIVDAQSTKIDGISGATVTSNAIKAAVADALAKVPK